MSESRTLFQRLRNGNDVRGVVLPSGEEKVTLSPDLAEFIARSFARYLAERTGKKPEELRVGVGRDSRITADIMKEGTLKGLSVLHAFDCGMITTPAMFQSVVLPESSFDGAVMLTASHLPFNRNGMKFFTREEGAVGKNTLLKILEGAASLAEEFGKADPEKIVDASALPDGGIPAQPFDMKTVYCRHMKRIICEKTGVPEEALPLKGLKIAEDAGNGAAGFFAPEILAPLGADVSGSVFLDPDGHFPNHVPNPENHEAMDAARKAVLNSASDLGVIFDCDGDRAAVVFADGTEANRNVLIALLSAIVAEQHPGSTVVTDSVTSDELSEFLTKKLGLRHLRYQRGYKNVIDRGVLLNQEGEDCELAIETSGHGAFRENHFSDDGAYIAAMIVSRMAVLKKEGKRIESLVQDLKMPAESVEMRCRITAEDFQSCGDRVLEGFRRFAEADPRFHIVTPNYEGVRVAFSDPEVKGWMLIRKSLHDPEIAINMESERAGGTEIIRGRILPYLKSQKDLKV